MSRADLPARRTAFGKFSIAYPRLVRHLSSLGDSSGLYLLLVVKRVDRILGLAWRTQLDEGTR